MSGLTDLQTVFVINAFLFQIILIVHFALRRWRFTIAVRYGWIVYALGFLSAAVSVWMLVGGMDWSFWVGGLLYLTWAIFGYLNEYIRKIEWRVPIYWPVFGPYVFLYLATTMFYWFPLALISKPLWYAYAVLFIISTILNVTSHKKSKKDKLIS